MATRRHTITGGPSKFDLMTSQYLGDWKHRQSVVFTLVNSHTISNEDRYFVIGSSEERYFVINGAEREDGTGESWLIKGWSADTAQGIKFIGCYSTQTRKGWIEYQD